MTKPIGPESDINGYLIMCNCCSASLHSNNIIGYNHDFFTGWYTVSMLCPECYRTTSFIIKCSHLVFETTILKLFELMKNEGFSYL